ncbi:MAG: type VI secretion system protein TssA [Pseudomonadota bacterium]
MIDVDALLQSFGDAAPSGPDLEYDPAFSEMEMAARPGEERQVGDAIIEAEEPDHAVVVEKAVAVLERSKDLRAAVFLAHATLKTDGLRGFELVMRYVRRCLEDYWDSCHPQLDADDDNDPTMRVNAAVGLTDTGTILRALRLAPLTESRTFGRFALRDVQVAEGEITPPSDMETVPDGAAISAAFQDTDPEEGAALAAAARDILDHVKAIATVFDEQVGSAAPDLMPLQKLAFDVAKQMGRYDGGVGLDEVDEGAAVAAPSGQSAGVAASPVRGGGGGAITGPDDVIAMLDRITDYYARSEPSSPVPLLLARARRLVSADFVTIMRDMAPQGIEQVAIIGGIPEDDDD